jgi:hypothetical protein
MKAHELAKQLLEGPDVQVIMQKDGEGNGYSPMSGSEEAVYTAYNRYSGEVWNLNWTADDCDMLEEAWEAIKNNPERKCVVLYPIN